MSALRTDFADKRYLRRREGKHASWASKVAFLVLFAVACIAFA